jgi:hypothetical protein
MKWILWLWTSLVFCQSPQLHPEDFKKAMRMRGLCLLLMETSGIKNRDMIADEKFDTITQATYQEMTSEDLIGRIGLPTRYAVSDTAQKPQTLRPLSLLPKFTQTLIHSLMARTRDTPPVNKDTDAKPYVEDLIRQKSTDLSHAERQVLEQKVGKHLGWDQSEIGAWYLITKDGRQLTAFHTSRLFNGVRTDDMMHSLIDLMQRHSLDLNQLASIDFYHSHPGSSKNTLLLSAQDETVAESFRNMLNSKNAQHIVHRFHAVAQASDRRIFVMSMEPVR